MSIFYAPTKIHTGPGALDVLRQLTAERALLVTDPFFTKSGLTNQVIQRLPGCRVEIFDRVVPDPPVSLAAEGVALCRRWNPQLLLALGGGSVMDCAKAIRLAMEMPMEFVAIPTTSGSGSEVTSFSILTRDGVKEPLVDPLLRPDRAILDESLLQELPQNLIADCGMDLLAHCLEALVAIGHSGFTDALATYGTKTVLERLKYSYHGDTSQRLALHEAATMAGLAFDLAGLGVCHALAHALGGMLHLPHGRLCAILLPPVLQANASAAMPLYAELARSCGLSGQTDLLAFRNLITAVERLRQQLNMPGNLREAGITQPQWKSVQEQIVQTALADSCCKTNPVPVDRSMLLEILRKAAG